MLALTSPTSGGRSVGIVRLRTKAMEFSFFSLTIPAQFILKNIQASAFNTPFMAVKYSA
jgi:hypothetical protein